MLDCSNKEVLKVLNLRRDHILIYLYQNVPKKNAEGGLFSRNVLVGSGFLFY